MTNLNKMFKTLDLAEGIDSNYLSEEQIKTFVEKANKLLEPTNLQYIIDKPGLSTVLYVTTSNVGTENLKTVFNIFPSSICTKIDNIIPTSLSGNLSQEVIEESLYKLQKLDNLNKLVKLVQDGMSKYKQANSKSNIEKETPREKEKPIQKISKPIWRENDYSLWTKTKATGTDFNEYGEAVIIQIVQADEWETGEITDFEDAYWFPQIEPDVEDLGEGNAYDLSPNGTGACSLEDSLKAIRNLNIAPPKYTTVLRFLKGIEAWKQTGTLQKYLQKHEKQLRELCS